MILCTHINVSKSGDNTKLLLYFKAEGNTLFPGGFLRFPGLAWSEDGDARFWWYQDDNGSMQGIVNSMWLQRTIPLPPPPGVSKAAITFTWFISFLSFVLYLMIEQDLSSVSGMSNYFSPKSCLEETWWLFSSRAVLHSNKSGKGLFTTRKLLAWLSGNN